MNILAVYFQWNWRALRNRSNKSCHAFWLLFHLLHCPEYQRQHGRRLRARCRGTVDRPSKMPSSLLNMSASPLTGSATNREPTCTAKPLKILLRPPKLAYASCPPPRIVRQPEGRGSHPPTRPGLIRVGELLEALTAS
jgi:hypothetical protein